MNNKTIWIITALIVVLLGGLLINKKTSTPRNTETTEAESVTPVTASPKRAGMPAIDISLCTKQPNDAYICPPNALADFGPATITDTTSGRTCEISYGSSGGFSFKGATKTATLTAGPLAVALYPSGNVATIARSAGQTLSIHAREDGALDHTLFVDSNYSTEQCLSVQ